MFKKALFLKDCLGLTPVDRLYYASPPPYSPNTVNQTVSYGGATWKGDPGGGWHLASSDSRDGSNDPLDAARKFRDFTVEANQPAISSYEASIPETQARFATERTRLEGQKEPVKQRYQNILDELKRREGVETSTATTNLAREYGKRGIPLSSGVYDQATERATGDISQFYGGQYKDVGLAEEDSLSGLDNLIAQLTGQETESIRAVRNAIASLQAGEPSSAISSALSLMSQRQQAEQFAAQQELENRQLGLQEQVANAPKPASTEIVTVGGRKKLINTQTGAVISDLGASSEGGGGSGIDLSGIISLLGGGSASTPKSFVDATSQTQYEKEQRARSQKIYG